MKKEEKLSVRLRIVEQRKLLPLSKTWTNTDDLKLEEAKLDTVKMA